MDCQVTVESKPVTFKITMGHRSIDCEQLSMSIYHILVIKCQPSEATLVLKYRGRLYPITYIIVDVTSTPLLGLKTSEELQLIKCVHTLEVEYSDIFEGLGCLEYKHKIKLEAGSTTGSAST